MIWLAILAVIVGLFLLVKSADAFIDGATEVAIRFKVPSFLIGVLILGVGTSAPEMVVSALSAMSGSPQLALGNAYGSNILNIALVLGLTVCISPLVIRRNLVKQDLMILMAVTIFSMWLLSDGYLTLLEGFMLLMLLAFILGLQIWFSLKNQQSTQDNQVAQNPSMSLSKAMITLGLGLLVLMISSRMIVWGAVQLATLWGLSELVIGLTIVAIGTSLPELIASIVAAKRGEHDMALGNIIGSNLFNTLGVVGLASVISPMKIDEQILSRDMLAVVVITALLLLMSLVSIISKKYSFGKWQGGVLLSSFFIYTFWLLKSTVGV